MDALMKVLSCCAVFVAILAGGAVSTAQPLMAHESTLARVRAAGELRCGIDAEEAEYTNSDDYGNRADFDADLCRAVAVAVLGKNARVRTLPSPDDLTAMRALKSGATEMVATLPDDFTHSAGTGLALTPPLLMDGIGFLLPDGSKIARARQLSGKKICFLAETHVEESARAWFRHEHLDFVPFPFQEEGEMQAAFSTGNCGALAGEGTRLAVTRAALERRGHHPRLLPERISREPLAAAVRADDPQWAAIVTWVMEALLAAEESGVTQANVEAMRKAAEGDPKLRFLLGGSREIGAPLGLDNDWVARVIEATGNYGEIYQRDLGGGSQLKLARGENSLRARGGILFALPVQ
jgi:general L-amino acid transport system substrate-binding protein